jgi:hypothetical protein
MLRKVDALLRFHFKVDPDTLSVYQYAELWQQLKFALDFEGRRFNNDGKPLEL